MPSDGRMLPLLDPEQLPYSVEGRWEPDEAEEVILGKRSFPVSTRSEYILGFGSFRDVGNRIVELDIADLRGSSMHELEGFHVFQALGNDPDSGKPVLQLVRIRDDRDKKMSFELHPGNELASVNAGDRLIVGMVDRTRREEQEKSAGSENEPHRAMRGQEEKQGHVPTPGQVTEPRR